MISEGLPSATSRPPAASRAARPAACGCPRAADGGHRATPAGQPRAGVQRVPTVVAGSDQDHHAGAVDGAAGAGEQVGGRGPTDRGRRAASTRRHRPPPSRRLPGRGSGRPCRRSARTSPRRRPSPRRCRHHGTGDRWTCRTPRARARFSTVPVITKYGLPPASVCTSASATPSPRGRRAPWPGLLGREPGRQRRHRALGLQRREQPLDHPGGALDRFGEPTVTSRAARRMPIPTIMVAPAITTRAAVVADHSTVTDLARLRGWSTS